jgi:hypothetical protein
MQREHRVAVGEDSNGTLHSLVHEVVGRPQAVVLVPIILACVVSPAIRGTLLVRSAALAGPVRNQRGAGLHKACALAGALPRRARLVVEVISVFLLC